MTRDWIYAKTSPDPNYSDINSQETLMLDWLKKTLKYKPAPVLAAKIEAQLSTPGDRSATLYGDIEFDTYTDGNWKLDIEIEHPQGAPRGPLEVRFNGTTVATLTPDRGNDTEKKFRSEYCDIALTPVAGTKVEVHGPSGFLLFGVFSTRN